jgi:aminoglycoside phosphotransferase (APT) family kinase protein
VYDHQPFDTFRHRVLAFATSTVWPEAGPEEVEVERLKGGGFNRIIGLAWKQEHYILRIPRFDAAQVGNDVAALLFLQQHTKIPAPRVKLFDESENNPLESPYAIQYRIPGTDLLSAFPDLSHENKCKVARELGESLNSMLAIQSSKAGKLVLPDGSKSLEAQINVTSFQSEDSELPEPFHAAPLTKTVCELLMSIFQPQTAHSTEPGPVTNMRVGFGNEFSKMASELDADGWFVNTHYALAHLDFEPRNILVNPTNDGETPIISSILDWDSAVLAPSFMTCAPPMWIWDWQDDEDEDERLANNEPSSPEGRELKTIFETAAGEEWVRLAYPAAYRLGRRLCRFAIDGVRSNEDFREAKDMLEEWKDIHSIGENRKLISKIYATIGA